MELPFSGAQAQQVCALDKRLSFFCLTSTARRLARSLLSKEPAVELIERHARVGRARREEKLVAAARARDRVPRAGRAADEQREEGRDGLHEPAAGAARREPGEHRERGRRRLLRGPRAAPGEAPAVTLLRT